MAFTESNLLRIFSCNATLIENTVRPSNYVPPAFLTKTMVWDPSYLWVPTIVNVCSFDVIKDCGMYAVHFPFASVTPESISEPFSDSEVGTKG